MPFRSSIPDRFHHGKGAMTSTTVCWPMAPRKASLNWWFFALWRMDGFAKPPQIASPNPALVKTRALVHHRCGSWGEPIPCGGSPGGFALPVQPPTPGRARRPRRAGPLVSGGATSVLPGKMKTGRTEPAPYGTESPMRLGKPNGFARIRPAHVSKHHRHGV